MSTKKDIFDLSDIRVDPSDPASGREEFVSRALSAVEDATFPHENVNREDAQSRIGDLLDRDTTGEFAQRVLTTGSKVYKRAFAHSIAGQPLSREEQRALTPATPKAAAGLAVPFQLDPTIIPISNGVVNPIRQVARVATLTDTDEWRGLTSTAITAQYRAEGAEATDGSPTIAQPTARVQRADAFVPFSKELGQDWGGLLSEMAGLLQEAKDDLESAQLVEFES